MKKSIFLFFFLSLCAGVIAQEVLLTGKITDEENNPLPFVNIMIIENNAGTVSDLNGYYQIELQPGIYTMLIRYMGCQTMKDTVIIREKEDKIIKNYSLINETIQIGAITVTAEDHFIPADPQTKTKIRADEIEHFQATSLNDITELLPGQRKTNPTLNYPEKASIRGEDNELGSAVIMDGIPLSNTANMQIGIGYTSANSGYDLRLIPADNIEEVEVIRGIPSVKYGDLTDGVMKVKTKSRVNPLRIKFKYNPHLYELNTNWGIGISGWALNTNLNLAVAERDIRIKDDGFTRFSGQFKFSKETEKLQVSNLIFFTRAYDESKVKPEYVDSSAWYNRDYNIKFSNSTQYKITPCQKLDFKFSLSYTHQDSYSQGIIARDNTVVSDLETDGTREGFIVFGSYLGKKWIKGEAWNIFTDFSYENQFKTAGFFHTFLAGVSWKDDFNLGEGLIFDPLYPPYSGTMSKRPRSYDDLPHYQNLSLYGEDRINGRFFLPFTLLAGIRIESYRPVSFSFTDFIKARQGIFFNPRVNLSINLTENSQIRGGFGKTSKAPPLGMIFKDKQYIDLSDTVSVVNPEFPDSNFSIITTSVFDQENRDLKAYTQDKYEISYDQQLGPAGFSLTFFYHKTSNKFSNNTIPAVLYKRSFPDWPDQSSALMKDTIMLYDYSININDGKKTTKGIEFTAKTKRIQSLHTKFSFDGAYYSEHDSYEEASVSSFPVFLPLIDSYVRPYFEYNETKSQRLLLNYRFDIQAKPLGIWITLHLQQEWFDNDKKDKPYIDDKGYYTNYPVGYYSQDGKYYSIPEIERSNPEYDVLRRTYEPYYFNEEKRPNLWLMNVTVSKSLWKGAEFSFFVNNLFNHRPYYQRKSSSPISPVFERRNPGLFFGIELSCQFQ